MSKPSIKLNYEQVQIHEQDSEEEDHWVVIKQLGQRYRRDQREKLSKKKKWRWGLIAVGSITVLLLSWLSLTSTQQKPIEKKYQHPQSRTPNPNVDSSLKNEPLISPKTQEKISDSNQIGSQQVISIKNSSIQNDRLQALHISYDNSQKHMQGKVEQSDLDQADHLPFKQHNNHEKLLFAFPTMGMKEPNTEFDFRSVAENLYYDYESKMYDFLKPFNDTDCILERLGDHNDGGYPLCTNFLGQTQALINLGVEGRDKFGCDLTTRKVMPNYQYDCTNSIQPICPSNSNNNFFSPECLSEKTEQTKMYRYTSLKNIIDSRNLTKKHIILKMDIEGGEWPGFRTFPREYLDYIDQIVMEIHNPGRNIFHQPYWGNLNIIEALQEKFIPVYLHMNPGACLDQFSMQPRKRRIPSFAIEVTLVNRGLITAKSASRAYRYQNRQQLYGLTFCDSRD